MRCLRAFIEVLERQYKKYFEGDLSEKLRTETKSIQNHNMDVNEVIGIFSAAQKSTTLCTVLTVMQNEGTEEEYSAIP